MIDLKMLNIWPKEDLEPLIKQFWKDGDICDYDSENNQWKRDKITPVALKCLHNSQDITVEFLREVRYFPIISN